MTDFKSTLKVHQHKKRFTQPQLLTFVLKSATYSLIIVHDCENTVTWFFVSIFFLFHPTLLSLGVAFKPRRRLLSLGVLLDFTCSRVKRGTVNTCRRCTSSSTPPAREGVSGNQTVFTHRDETTQTQRITLLLTSSRQAIEASLRFKVVFQRLRTDVRSWLRGVGGRIKDTHWRRGSANRSLGLPPGSLV